MTLAYLIGDHDRCEVYCAYTVILVIFTLEVSIWDAWPDEKWPIFMGYWSRSNFITLITNICLI
jgi:hypothetical protein